MVDWSAAVPVVALAAVLTQSAGGVMSTADTYSAATTTRQEEQLGVETTPARMGVAVARYATSTNNTA